mmetsp:Transcript_12311/g.26576  ORF Transcript_12311/g.26576 Transcript_12311/m.26576 type:complete len:521 (-) Transcript_12311:277-1839(-)|eukprot:CAMPEP_0202919936 /NCGR_PEP_ID=MMETSP1392-20130828/76593_1 /ASSEMBLY_ACC=CAM_ASM_000868 /TAXON_ID=225041 /ORGANISM="Chlamydomonas chlamydogama, Strain SAG 11-48b" /LENGTH=520 /DNA_ID=CAMNT_0049613403 /DNA_START=111 /DNA_END=1673 /DNA_ORIENTATION=+
MPATTAQLTKVAEVGGSLKQVQQAFQAFQVARTQFIHALGGFLDKKDPTKVTLEALMKNDVMAVLCCPLAQDPVPGIQASALSCLGKLANADPLLSQVVVSCGVLDSIVTSMSHESAPVQAAADNVLSSVARSSTDFARGVMTAGALPPLMTQLQSAPHTVKEEAVRTLNALIQSSEEHALLICNDQLLSTLVALMLDQASPHSLVKTVVQALGNIAARSVQLAEALVKHNALQPVCTLARGGNTPPDLKAAAFHCLSHVCRHHEELANQVANTGVVQAAVQCLTDKMTPSIRRNAAALLLQMVQKTPDLAQVVSASSAPACLKQYMQLEKDATEGKMVGCMIAGCMSSYKPSIAKAVVDAGAGAEVVLCIPVKDDELSGTAAWAVEQMAAHGDESTMPLVSKGALLQLLDVYPSTPEEKTELRAKLKSAIKAVLYNVNSSEPLHPYINLDTPPDIYKHLLRKLKPLLASPKARQAFVTSGALMRLQQAIPGLDEKGTMYAQEINALFPEDVVTYYAGQK